ncbi:type I glyceraldehyde-3-phosphate dehydrogenase [Aciditerrimonas ferrireducens]|uniref:Type I glyceraldehyde-3-phosphate dehydrogenase n=1 Tax=Aciditerrimonas ferrireducens TaxID=667306 RepID=A0ABV6C729_9ACTN|nr:type I glyceraldehyde-3-phosphate dehydrogenase [Aciditerrimonas ferrireducens]MCK4176769.1 type I glyceraldehyde-3-phosphate dehydrogenase [Aciditerrimonas ferrireducens]
MTARVAINGFGRIGRNFLRAAAARRADLEVVAVNDLTDPVTNAQLLRRDTTHGAFPGSVEVADDALVVEGRRIAVLAERDPRALPWGQLGVQVVVESTGRFTDREQAAAHLEAGAERVAVSAPAKGADLTVVMGVNHDAYDPARHRVVSNASCTTNCFVPMVKVLDDAFGIQSGLMTTVHAVTNDQNLLDLAHKDPRRARAAAFNIVPSTTGAARATALALPAMQGKLDGTALRVPVPDGSITDCTAVVAQAVDAEGVNAAFRKAAADGPLAGILEVSDEPLVSSDIVGNPASCILDAGLTMTMALPGGGTLVKVFGWYDNEWGYANRLLDLVLLLARS